MRKGIWAVVVITRARFHQKATDIIGIIFTFDEGQLRTLKLAQN